MTNKGTSVELAPLRSLDDFILRSARFQVPNFDTEKWGNRIAHNLLYYQTNYFLMALVIFIIVGVIHPLQMILGFLVTALMFLMFCYLTNGHASQFKKKHPVFSVIFVLAACYFLTYMFGSLLIFFVGILVPFCATFVHASLRLRNLKNKISNQVETLGLERTPMGIFLQELGM